MGIYYLIIFVAALFLSFGCVSIPVSHFTVEQDGYSCSINEECLCEDSELPDSYPDAATQGDGLDPERITLFNWNSHK